MSFRRVNKVQREVEESLWRALGLYSLSRRKGTDIRYNIPVSCGAHLETSSSSERKHCIESPTKPTDAWSKELAGEQSAKPEGAFASFKREGSRRVRI
jgi:hypothetical protein